MPETKTEPKYLVTTPVAFGPEVSDTPRTAAEILKGHPSLRKNTPEAVAAQCVLAGQWKPHEGAETMTETGPTAQSRIDMLEKQVAEQAKFIEEMRRMKPEASNRMKPAAQDR